MKGAVEIFQIGERVIYGSHGVCQIVTTEERVIDRKRIKGLHQHKEQQIELGREFHQCDEYFLNDAQKLLTTEFSLVMDIDPSCVGAYILETLEK